MHWLVIVLFISYSIIKGNTREGLIISFMVLITSLLKDIPVDHFIYNTILIIIYSVFYRYSENNLIKSSISILIKFSLVSFIFGIADEILYLDITWQLILSWSYLYEYVYYSTIILILAGLAKSDHGGIRNNSVSDKLLFNDNHSIKLKRI